jgi:large subunit ribosomal protein L22
MEIKVSAKYLAVSPQKSRLVAPLLAGKNLEEALAYLGYETKYIARPMAKLIKSAQASAEEKGLDKDKLVIKQVTVDAGPIGKKQRIRARGRADLQKRRTSHITVILSEEETKKVEKVKKIQKVEPVKLSKNKKSKS